MQISSKASVSKNAVIGKNVKIGDYTVIDDNVKIGDGTTIGPNVYITGWTDIGKNCQIHSGAVIGDIPQDYGFKNEKSFVIIGDNNIIREFVTIHRGTQPNSQTIIGNNNMFMAYSHIAHNCVVEDNVVLVNHVSLAGYVTVMKNAFVSAVTQIHQFCRIGKYVMIGAISKVTKDIPHYMLAQGADLAEIRGLNSVGLRRANFSIEQRELIKKAYVILYKSNLNVSQALQKIKEEKELIENDLIKDLITFIETSKRGIAPHFKGKTSLEEF
jgi:UDP-N-acetylglucosamine acyltransferase